MQGDQALNQERTMASTDINSYGTGGTDAWAQRPGPAGAVRGTGDSGYDEGSDANVGQAERWASLLGGGVIALAGLRRGDSVGLAAAVVGGLFLYRGLTGHSPIYDQLDVSTASRGSERGLAGLVRSGEVHLESVVTIDAAPDELYSFWRNFENHTRFASFVESVTPQDGNRAHWVLKVPLGATIEWDTEVTEERPGEYLAWRAVESSDLTHEGSVRFRPATGERGTVVQMKMDITPPLGPAGAAVGKLLEGVTETQLRADLKKLKQLMETGEIATTEGQPSGRGRD
ncbi:hypothetical protein BH24GEM3_BH24GEM3_18470 [soil metagenome]